jgi:ubiquinone/menaquinone biosynthesis C-methylase UbiE
MVFIRKIMPSNLERQSKQMIVSLSEMDFSGCETSIVGKSIPKLIANLEDGGQQAGSELISGIKEVGGLRPLLGIKSDTPDDGRDLSIRGALGGHDSSAPSSDYYLTSSETDKLSFTTEDQLSESDYDYMDNSLVTILEPETQRKPSNANEASEDMPSRDLLPQSNDIVSFERKNAFDLSETAEGYYRTTPPLAKRYLRVLQNDIFKPETNSGKDYSFIDVGCGNGIVSIELATKYENMKVVGLDRSEAMLKLAVSEEEKRGKENKVDWKNIPVEDLRSEDRYDGIFSHDSVHLFANPKESIKGLAKRLKPGGSFAIGSVMYAFDRGQAEDVTKRVYKKYNIDTDWGDWESNNFSDYMTEEGLEVEKLKLSARALYTPGEIADYLRNVSLTAKLKEDEKDRLRDSLYMEFKSLVGHAKYAGEDKYTLIIGTKPKEA